MKIRSLTLQNFRSFGPQAQTIHLSGLTAFVGSNSCGKSTILLSLTRLFGLTMAERTLRQGDFHIPRYRSPDEIDSIDLVIEAILEFEELEGEDDPGDAVPQCFRQMLVDDQDGTPYCRARLEGRWTRGNLPEGEIEQTLYWIKTPGEIVGDDKKLKLPNHDRSRIHLHYIPASRDPLRHIRQASGSMMHRLFRAINWTEDMAPSVESTSDSLSDKFRSEPGVQLIRSAIMALWNELHPHEIYSEVHLKPLSRRFEEFLTQVEAVFGPAPEGREHSADRLSDGLKSLFYLTLIGTVFDLEQATPADVVPTEGRDSVLHGLSRDRLDPPSLTILAVEEPENHLAPHYLGRIMGVLRKVSDSVHGQVLLSSHSPSILKRVEPEEVRYLRLDHAKHTTLVRSIELPPKAVEAHKFVREAVRTFPELYFAKLVVLGEGDSEEVVLPRIAEAHGVKIDASFVSIVPLGGRHVNHLWRLLSSLEIPYVTLLDLDREREGGAWGRIKYVIKQLLEAGKPRDSILTSPNGDGTTVLPKSFVEQMHKRPVNQLDAMAFWIKRFEEHGVFFSAPLDLDFLMLRSFSSAYEVVPEGAEGPEIPEPTDEDFGDQVELAIRSVLKKGSDGSTYAEDERAAFFWYRYLFLGRGKPTTHIEALARLTDEEIRNACPAPLKRLIDRMKRHLDGAKDEAADGTF